MQVRKSLCLGVGLAFGVLAVILILVRLGDGPRYQGKTARQWVRELADDQRSGLAAHHEVFEALKQFGASNAVPALVGELKAKPFRSSRAYRNLYGTTPSFIRPWLPRPFDLEPYRFLIFGALSGFDANELKDAVPDLVDLLDDNDPPLRINAAWILGRVGPPAKDALPALWKTLNNRRYSYLNYAEAIQKIDPHNNELLALMMDWLRDKEAKPYVKTWTAKILGRMGSGATSALPLLIEARESQDEALSNEAGDAIWLIERDTTLQSTAP